VEVQTSLREHRVDVPGLDFGIKPDNQTVSTSTHFNIYYVDCYILLLDKAVCRLRREHNQRSRKHTSRDFCPGLFNLKVTSWDDPMSKHAPVHTKRDAAKPASEHTHHRGCRPRHMTIIGVGQLEKATNNPQTKSKTSSIISPKSTPCRQWGNFCPDSSLKTILADKTLSYKLPSH